MRAVRVIDGSPVLDHAPEPSADGVRIDIAAAAICGSDLHLIDGGMVEGRILGHEFAGRTPDGTAVAIEPLGRCGTCDRCTRGSWMHCHELVGYGIFADGGMAERIVVPEETLTPLPMGVDLRNASLVEPLAVAVHGVRRARLAASDRVAIVGAGPIGLALTAVCRAADVTPDVVARHDHQRAAVERLGGAVAPDEGPDPGPGAGHDVVFDAVGTGASLATSVRSARAEGRVALVGTLWGPAEIDVTLCLEEIELVGSSMYGAAGGVRDFERAVEILAAEPAIADTLITHRFPLDAAGEAFATARDREAGAIKVVFEPAG